MLSLTFYLNEEQKQWNLIQLFEKWNMYRKRKKKKKVDFEVGH